MTRLLAAAVSVLALSAGAAAAQNSDWTGGYVGGHVGYGAAGGKGGETIQFDKDLNGSFNDTVTTSTGANAFSPGFCGGAARGPNPADGCAKDGKGADYGVRAGYDKQLNNGVVVGVVGEVSKTNADDSVSAYSTTPASYAMTRKVEGVAAIRGRAGVAMDQYMPYVTAGVARGKIDSSFKTTNTANTFATRGDDAANGYQVGAGVERKIGTKWAVGAEYLYTRLHDDSYRVRAQGPAPANNPFLAANPSGTDFARSDEGFRLKGARITATYRF